MLDLKTLKYDLKAGRDIAVTVGQIVFTPAHYPKKEDAATAFLAALKAYAEANDYDPDNVIMNPDYYDGQGPCVCWEEGFYQWGQYMTEYLHNAPHWYTEPFHSFDVCFCDM